MANKRARDRQLAKLAARRQAERRTAQRRRKRIVGVTVVVVAGLAVGAFAVLTRDDSAPQASAAPTGSVGPSPSSEPAEPGSVKNEADIPAKVACGGSAPKAAGEDKPQFPKAPPERIDPAKTYTATIATSCGDIDVKLDPKDTPVAVNNFVYLANKGFYDGLWFHRIFPGFVIQGGDPLGTGLGGPGYAFTTESNPKLTYTDNGYLLAYANSGPDTNGSQLFVTIGPQPDLDPPQGPYTAFGQVTKGQDVVDEIGAVPVEANSQGEKSLPTEAVYIESVKIAETR